MRVGHLIIQIKDHYFVYPTISLLRIIARLYTLLLRLFFTLESLWYFWSFLIKHFYLTLYLICFILIISLYLPAFEISNFSFFLFRSAYLSTDLRKIPEGSYCSPLSELELNPSHIFSSYSPSNLSSSKSNFESWVHIWMLH